MQWCEAPPNIILAAVLEGEVAIANLYALLCVHLNFYGRGGQGKWSNRNIDFCLA